MPEIIKLGAIELKFHQSKDDTGGSVEATRLKPRATTASSPASRAASTACDPAHFVSP